MQLTRNRIETYTTEIQLAIADQLLQEWDHNIRKLKAENNGRGLIYARNEESETCLYPAIQAAQSSPGMAYNTYNAIYRLYLEEKRLLDLLISEVNALTFTNQPGASTPLPKRNNDKETKFESAIRRKIYLVVHHPGTNTSNADVQRCQRLLIQHHHCWQLENAMEMLDEKLLEPPEGPWVQREKGSCSCLGQIRNGELVVENNL